MNNTEIAAAMMTVWYNTEKGQWMLGDPAALAATLRTLAEYMPTDVVIDRFDILNIADALEAQP